MQSSNKRSKEYKNTSSSNSFPSMATKATNVLLRFLCFFLLIIRPCHSQQDTIFRGKNLTWAFALRSMNGKFSMEFLRFSTISISGDEAYLAISYNDAQSTNPVWVANRDSPISYTNSIDARLMIAGDGSLKMVRRDGVELISLYAVERSMNTSATLEDSGNFVLYEMNSNRSRKRMLWQSFDHPTDTFLPGMKLGIDFRTGRSWSFTSWRGEALPSAGSFTLGMDPDSKNRLVIWRRGKVYWTSGPFRNGFFQGEDGVTILWYLNFTHVLNENEAYFNYSVAETSVNIFPRLRMDSTGRILPYTVGYPMINCDPSLPDYRIDAGCLPQILQTCRNPYDGEKFNAHRGYMTVYGFKFNENENMTLEDCKIECMHNCSCAAYAPARRDFNNGISSGCEIWSSTGSFRKAAVEDYRRFTTRDIYFIDKDRWWWLWLTIALGGVIIFTSSFSVVYIIWMRFKEKEYQVKTSQTILLSELGVKAESSAYRPATSHDEETNELQVFSFSTIALATNYFSTQNKLGQGGFGPVYKGKLDDGREIAIKRLSRSSGQGLVEFKNEALLISRLQHTNLVRLLGFCIHGVEKMLIYEFMTNKSLDFFLYDSKRKHALDWKRRFNIIEGVAQGLLYLHKYSRLRVIHRDMKPGNILLDDKMNPKISDFGMARIFEQEESEANTHLVVGTYGYMSPEYSMGGVVSTKVDVFSFGVLVIEIVSGKKNHSFQHPNQLQIGLIGYAWELWKEGKGLDLLDNTIQGEDSDIENVFRCLHVGLLCVQNQAKDRPEMFDVVAMLSNQTMQLPLPKHPGFYVSSGNIASEGNEEKPEIKSEPPENCSVNQVTQSVMEAR